MVSLPVWLFSSYYSWLVNRSASLQGFAASLAFTSGHINVQCRTDAKCIHRGLGLATPHY